MITVFMWAVLVFLSRTITYDRKEEMIEVDLVHLFWWFTALALLLVLNADNGFTG